MAAPGCEDNGVVLKSYTFSRSQTVHGSMPSRQSIKPRLRRPLDLQCFFEEFKRIREARTAEGRDREQEDDEEEARPRQEGEEEADWLKEVGLSSLVSNFEANKELDASDVDAETSKLQLTVAQEAAVRRRVDTLNATIRRKRQMHILQDSSGDIRQLFLQPDKKEESQENSVSQRNGSDDVNHVSPPLNGEDHQVPNEDDLDLESGVVGLPDVPIESSPIGLTRIDDLSTSDVETVKRRALIELTTILENNGIQMKVRKAPKRKYRESGVFGVPIVTMVARDKMLDPMTRTPLFLQEIIGFLEDKGIMEEGILRVPGASTRLRMVQQELEEKFPEGKFSWDGRRTTDAATLLKQFLRDLPYPLLTHEYLHIFASVEDIADIKDKIVALNLLTLLLPTEHRDTLKTLLVFLDRVVSHEEQNKMTLNNVAMIMAPNLFFSRGNRRQDPKDAQADLKMAACTCNVVRILIRYHNLMWLVPQQIMDYVRFLNDTESDKRRIPPRGARKAVHKKKGSGSPVHVQKQSDDKNEVTETPRQEGRMSNIIRVQSPHFSKVSMCVELTSRMTAGDIVAKFRKKSFEDMASKGVGPKQHPVVPRRQSFGTGLKVDTSSQPLDNHHLFEVGGNIGERCLDPNTVIAELLKVNPNARWVIKQKALDL